MNDLKCTTQIVVSPITAVLLPYHVAGDVARGLGALAMPTIHRNNRFSPAVAMLPGGGILQWTLMAPGVTGGLAARLSARALWRQASRS